MMNHETLIREELARAGEPSQFTPAVARLFENRITPASEVPEMDFLFSLFGVACFPRGELVAVAGKAKSGKTFYLSLLMSKGIGEPPGQEDEHQLSSLQRRGDTPLRILWYDTEQSRQTTKEILVGRILRMAGVAAQGSDERTAADERLFVFNVRTFSCEERLKMFQEAVSWLKPDLVILDGVRDLISDINDGREAQRMTELLMALAQDNDCCIVSVLHQNKSDSDRNLRGWIGTELTNKVFEVYSCEKLRDSTFKVEQTHTRKHDIGRELFYRVNPETELPETADRPGSDQPRDKQGRWVSMQQPTDLRKLFITAMEGRRQRPFSEVMAVALKKCGVVDAKAYYSYFEAAEQQGIIRKEAHQESGTTWVEMIDNALPF